MDQIRHQAQGQMLTAEHEIARHLEEIRHVSLRQIGELDQGIENLWALIAHLGVQRISEAEQAIEAFAWEILGLGPQATMKRGFALVHDIEGKTVTSATKARRAQDLDVEFHDGSVRVKVNEPSRGNEP